MQLPNNWNLKTLSELGTCHIGLTYKPDNVVTEGGTLVLRSSNVQESKLAFENNVFVNIDISDKLKVKSGDILICVRNGSRSLIGKSAVIKSEHLERDMTFGAFMSVYRTEYSDYVRHLFHSDMYYRQIRNNLGATINQITNKNLNSFAFPFPENEQERKKIAKVLSTVDEKIDLIDKKIAETRKLKTGLMQKLFSEGVGVQDKDGNWQPHTEFQDSPVGRIPSSWSVGTIKQMTTNFNNQRIPLKSADRQKRQGEFRYYGAQGVIDYIDDYIFDGRYLLIAEDGENIKSRKQDIAQIAEGQFWVNNHAHVVQGSPEGDIDFVMYILNHISIQEYVTGQAQPKLNKASLEKITVPKPSLSEQKVISSILATVDHKVGLLRQQKAETQQLKKGLMQKLLTGEWRVPLEDREAA